MRLFSSLCLYVGGGGGGGGGGEGGAACEEAAEPLHRGRGREGGDAGPLGGQEAQQGGEDLLPH